MIFFFFLVWSLFAQKLSIIFIILHAKIRIWIRKESRFYQALIWIRKQAEFSNGTCDEETAMKLYATISSLGSQVILPGRFLDVTGLKENSG